MAFVTFGPLVPDGEGHFDGTHVCKRVAIDTAWGHWPIAVFVSGPLLAAVREWRRAQAKSYP